MCPSSFVYRLCAHLGRALNGMMQSKVAIYCARRICGRGASPRLNPKQAMRVLLAAGLLPHEPCLSSTDPHPYCLSARAKALPPMHIHSVPLKRPPRSCWITSNGHCNALRTVSLACTVVRQSISTSAAEQLHLMHIVHLM